MGFPVDAGCQGVVERPPAEVPQVKGVRDARVTCNKYRRQAARFDGRGDTG